MLSLENWAVWIVMNNVIQVKLNFEKKKCHIVYSAFLVYI